MDRFDFHYPPYNKLSPAEQALLQKSVDIAFFGDGEIIIEAEQDIGHLYVVIKGLIKEVEPDGEVIAVYRARDTFEARAMMEGCSQNRFIVAEEALVYAIPKNTVLDIMAANPRFSTYFYASVAEKMTALSGDPDEQELESLFTATVRDAYRQNTVWLNGEATVLDAALVMKEHKTKSILVHHQEQVGLFTESAFRDITIAGAPGSNPLHQWSRFDLISIDMDDYVFNALLRMTQFNIQRLVVIEAGHIVGTLEQIDVLAYFSNHSHLVAQRLDRANSIDELIDIAGQMTRSIQLLRNNGVGAPQLAQLMQVLNSSLFEKAWRILAPPELYEQSCLIVMGSEGRGEQILKTDQDNGLIIRDSVDPELARTVSEQFSATLTRLGYPPCPGNIMVSNAEWRKTLDEYKRMVAQWCRAPSPDAMMKLAIFVDAKAVAGDAALLEDVKAHLQKIMINDVGMLMTFARSVEMFDHHSRGFFSRLLSRDESEQMDIKKMGIFPVVHGARALCLEARVEETNTFERLQKLVQLHVLDATLGKDTAEALSYLMDLRLKANLQAFNLADGRVPNQLDIAHLSTLERDLLKDALQVVKRFKNMIHQHFHLGGS